MTKLIKLTKLTHSNIGIFVFVSLVTLSGSTHGEESPLTARELFERGTESFTQEDYEGALRFFERSFEIRPLPVVLYNIAMCQRALTNYSESLATFNRCLSEFGDSFSAETTQEIEDQIETLQSLIEQTNLRPEATPQALNQSSETAETTYETSTSNAETNNSSEEDVSQNADEMQQQSPDTPELTLSNVLENSDLNTMGQGEAFRQPRFYQNWWFWVLLTTTVAAAAVSIFLGFELNTDDLGRGDIEVSLP